MRRARIIAELVGEPNFLRSGVIEGAWSMVVLLPQEAEYQSMRLQVVHGPWLDIIQLDKFEALDSKTPSQRSENACTEIASVSAPGTGHLRAPEARTWIRFDDREWATDKVLGGGRRLGSGHDGSVSVSPQLSVR